MDFTAVQIGEEHILALRSFLLHGPEAWVPLQETMQKNNETAAGYTSLLFGAFEVAVRRRFAPTYTVGRIVRLVADLRITLGEDADAVNPIVAEDMIRRAVDAPPLKADVPDDLTAALNAQVCILLYLIGEADFDRVRLEQFIDEATAYTEQWLAARQNEQAEQR